MKKILLGTTALVGASVVASSAIAMPIQSKSEEGTPILTASIVAQFEGGIADNDANAKGNTRDGGFVNGRFAEVFFNGELTADNGLVYGARIHLGTGGDGSAATNLTTAGFPGREYIYFQGGWGSVNLGNWPGADTLLNLCLVCNTYYGYGGFDTPWRSYVINNGRGPGFGNMTVNANWFNYAVKATYLTPVIAGFQAGVSYSPERTSTPATGSFADNNGNDKDMLGFGLQWNGDFGDVSLAVSGIAAIANGDQTAAYAGTTNNQASLDTTGLGTWEVGAVVRYAGFHFGGSYWDDGTSGARPGRDFGFESDGWTLDGGYKTGPFAIELQYINSHRQGSSAIFGATGHRQIAGVVGGVAGANAQNSVEQFDQQGFLASFGYDVAPGLKWYVELGHFDFDYTPHSIPGLAAPTNIDNSGIVGLSGVVLSF